MPKVFPKEFREDVVRVARNREPGVTIAQVAKDFGIHQGTLEKWLYRERVDRARRLVSRRVSTRNYVSYASETDSSSKKSRCCGVRPRICRRRICRENDVPARK